MKFVLWRFQVLFLNIFLMRIMHLESFSLVSKKVSVVFLVCKENKEAFSWEKSQSEDSLSCQGDWPGKCPGDEQTVLGCVCFHGAPILTGQHPSTVHW